MAVTITDVGTVASGAGTASPTAPSGSGGVLVLFATHRSLTTMNDPTGWTRRGRANQGNGLYVYLWDRVSDGGADDSPTVTATSGTIAMNAAILRLSGTDPTSYFDIGSRVTWFDNSIDGSGAIPTFNVSDNDSLQFLATANQSNSASWTFNSPLSESGLIERTAAPGMVIAQAARNSGTVAADTYTTSLSVRKAGISVCYCPPRGGATFETIAAEASTTTTSLAMNAPSGVQVGETLIACVACENAQQAQTPTGWTLIRYRTQSTASIGITTFWRIADGTSDDTPTITFSGTPSSLAKGTILRFSGCHATTPIDASTDSTDPGFVATNTIPTVTVANNNSMTVYVAGNIGTGSAWPEGWDERFDSSTTTGLSIATMQSIQEHH
jgi:hypothetical protein